MATLESLQKEIDRLKQENRSIKQRLAKLEPKESPKAEPARHQEAEQHGPSVTGIILIVIGGLLTLTFFGAIIGIPLLIVGIILTAKEEGTRGDSKSPEETQKERPAAKEPKGSAAEETRAAKEKRPAKKASLEENIGVTWFARIGILALVIGAGFFIKLAIDNNWIDHLTRIILGVLLGVGLVVLGQRLAKQKRYAFLGKTLIGGGLAFTYFVVYAAYHFDAYRQAIGITQLIDVTLLTIVVLVTVVFALKDDSRVIAGEAFFLGFLTSLLSTEFQVLTLLYALLLTLGLVYLSTRKQWAILGFGGAIATYLIYLVWFAQHTSEAGLGALFLTLYFIAYLYQSLKLRTLGIQVALLNGAAFYGLMLWLVSIHQPAYDALFTLALGLLYLLLSFTASRLNTTHCYGGLLFLALAVPLQLNHEWVTIIWALGALLLTALAAKHGRTDLRYSAYALTAAVLAKSLLYDIFFLTELHVHDLLASTRAFSLLVTVAALYLMHAILTKQPERNVPAIYAWAATGLLVLLAFLELQAYPVALTLVLAAIVLALLYESRHPDFRLQPHIVAIILLGKLLLNDRTLAPFDATNILGSTRLLVYAIGIILFLLLSRQRFGDLYAYGGGLLAFVLLALELQAYWISVGWSLLAILFIIAGFRMRRTHYRLIGIGLFAITILKVFLYDTRNLETLYRTLSYVVLGALLLAVSYLYARYKETLKQLL